MIKHYNNKFSAIDRNKKIKEKIETIKTDQDICDFLINRERENMEACNREAEEILKSYADTL